MLKSIFICKCIYFILYGHNRTIIKFETVCWDVYGDNFIFSIVLRSVELYEQTTDRRTVKRKRQFDVIQHFRAVRRRLFRERN